MAKKTTVTAELTFIRGGISSKNKRPYLQVSNGRAEFFVTVPKNIDQDDFEAFCGSLSDGDVFVAEVEILVGSDSVTLVSLPEEE